MDYLVHASLQNSGMEFRYCATRTDVENFMIEKLRTAFDNGEDVLFHVSREN